MPSPENVPERIGRYEIETELGRGMMGAVYKATDPQLGRTVALKVIRLAFPVSTSERETFEKRFVAEGHIVGRLSHPGIVVVHDVGRDEASGTPYLALEYLHGKSLDILLDEGRVFDWKAALRIIAPVARALAYAHDEGIVHRDIKPGNIMILSDGEPKVMDFGVAKLQTGFGLTSTGDSIGTPLYMAPEQAMNEAVDGRTDLFSLGSVAYTLLVGKPAFAADNVPLILGRVAFADPPPPSSVKKKLPKTLDYLLARALAKRPEQRYRDGRELAEDAEDILRGKKPRHQKGWKPPAPAQGDPMAAAVGSGTGVSKSRSEEHTSEEPLFEAPALFGADHPPARTRPHWVATFVVFALSLATLGGTLLVSDYWRPRLLEGLRAGNRAEWTLTMRRALVSAAQEGTVQIEATFREWATGAGLIPPPAAPPGAIATPTPASRAELALVSTPRIQAPGWAFEAAPARLSVTLSPAGHTGWVRLWIDEDEVFGAMLDEHATTQTLVFREATRLHGILPVPAGEHRVRAVIESPSGALTGEIVGEFDSDSSRHLDVRVGDAPVALLLDWRTSPAEL